MKSKLSWIPFIPIVFAAVFLRVYQVLFVDSGVDKGFLDSGAISLIFVGSIILLVILLAVLCAADKKTSPEYRTGRNIFAGVFGMLSGVLLLTDAFMLFKGMAESGNALVAVINGVFTVLGGVMIFVMGLSSLTGNNLAKKVPFLMLFPTIWSAARLIITFLSYTTISVNAIDMSDLVYMVFTTLFLYNASMLYIGLKSKNPVKACFLYGLPAVAVVFAYTGAWVSSVVHSGQPVHFLSNIKIFEYLALALFIIFFLVELTAKAQEKTPEAEMETEAETAGTLPETHENLRQSLSETAQDPETLQAQKIMEQVEAAETKEEPVEYVGYYDRKDSDKKEKNSSDLSDYASKLDDIDRLILEISSKDSKD